MSRLPIVFSLSGYDLTDQEATFFASNKPFGFILFKRNIDTPSQLKTLIRNLRDICGSETHVLIDQEGGRVQRLKEPHWSKYPCMQECQDEVELKNVIRLLSKDLTDVGININCAPVLDILQSDTDTSIGDRAFSEDPEIVSKLSIIACKSFINSGITPIIKHLPGHGRAVVDSHAEIPFVDASLQELQEHDFIPFQNVLKAFPDQDLWGMVGHCLYRDVDSKHPASLSPKIIQDVIREDIGLKGLLFSDDLSMGALSAYGDISERAQKCLDAGCDIALYCAGHLDEMQAITCKIN